MTPAEFRAIFPEFASAVYYPDQQINFWLDLADKLLRVDKWKTLRESGITLYVAHNLTLERQALLAGAGGRPPGLGSGIVASKSVGGASVSYQSLQSSFNNAGSWVLTLYGMRMWNLIQIVGMGGMQL